MLSFFGVIRTFLSSEFSRLRTKPRALLRVRWRQLKSWIANEIYLNTRPRRLLKAGRELIVGAMWTGLAALLILAIVKLDLFPWLTKAAL
jgi:hypothetical protein